VDRDENAAKNILDEGIRKISAGTVDYTGGDDVRLSNQHLSAKPEAQPIGSAVGG
jgi:transposase